MKAIWLTPNVFSRSLAVYTFKEGIENNRCLVGICYVSGTDFSLIFTATYWGRRSCPSHTEEGKWGPGRKATSVSPDSCSALVWGQGHAGWPRSLLLHPPVPASEPPPSSPHPTPEPPIRVAWEKNGAHLSLVTTFSQLWGFLWPTGLIHSVWIAALAPQSEDSFHLSVWPLPKTCFQFLKKLDLFPPLFGMSLKPCFSLKRKKKKRKSGFLYHLLFLTSQEELG